MISKKIALTSILLSSSVWLNGCDLLESESHNTPAKIAQIPIANTSCSKSTEEPKTPKDSLDFSTLLKLSPQDATNILRMHPSKEIYEFLGHNHHSITQAEQQFLDARKKYMLNPKDKNAEKYKDETEAYFNKVHTLDEIIESTIRYRGTIYGEKRL
ncbi:hypothetical protein CKC_04655 [Candidatus Liberibacter solanacearum CLso-ZC1]|uniref:Lipoprotein n=1 Tax=Liberibacter solanacearum (strain CLso-ZC1) TaxID=658172 RepID=E4UDK2_LIBSC|nr:hypothetical protein [Candidatus Liberibacter solanacearum]ADR52680.1 hypothetical protein CKC_04655 [Candidatus Liberibacter solanacearum CLso-ZC1]